jgi:hypothetical protein
MYLLTYIYRTASSGSESRTNTIFETLEKAVKYIKTEWYDSLCEINDYPSEWNEDDLGPMPSRESFTLESVKRGTIFAPYDKYHAIVQNELILDILN